MGFYLARTPNFQVLWTKIVLSIWYKLTYVFLLVWLFIITSIWYPIDLGAISNQFTHNYLKIGYEFQKLVVGGHFTCSNQKACYVSYARVQLVGHMFESNMHYFYNFTKEEDVKHFSLKQSMDLKCVTWFVSFTPFPCNSITC